MTTDLAGAVRTAVDEARRLAEAATPGPWEARPYVYGQPEDGYGEPTDYEVVSPSAFVVSHQPHEGGGANRADAQYIAYWNPSRALAMCDWADDVLARHTAKIRGERRAYCDWCAAPSDAFSEIDWPCQEFKILAAAFGVETGETP